MGFPGNLIEVIAAVIELTHHGTEVWRRRIPWLQAKDNLPDICLTGQVGSGDQSV
jgi:hypothetical protein